MGRTKRPEEHKKNAEKILSSHSKWQGYTVYSVVDGGRFNKIQLMCAAGHIVRTNISKMSKGEQCGGRNCQNKKNRAAKQKASIKKIKRFFQHPAMNGYVIKDFIYARLA